MDPTENDVLSGRGAWFNQHPGNKQFRTMLEEKKEIYMAGTKKQKMNISKAIVEAIYSMDPPGRFLKKCPESGQWNELSKRDAADRAAQAMAYVIKGESLKEKKRRRRCLRLPPPSQSQTGDGLGRKLSHSINRPTPTRLEGNHSSPAANHELAAGREGAVGTWNGTQSATDLLHMPGNSNTQHHLFLQQLQQSSNAATIPTIPTSVGNISNNQSEGQIGLAQPQHLVQMFQEQPHQQQQILLQLQYTLALAPPNNPLGRLLQSQSAPQSALYEGAAYHLLNQAQQQQQQQQQQLFLHRLLNQQNVHQSASFASPPVSISTSAPFLTAHLANSNNIVQNEQQPNVPSSSNALSLLGGLSRNISNQQSSNNAEISNAPQHRSIEQHQQLLYLQQELQPALQADQYLRNHLPSINCAGMTSTNDVPHSTRQAENDDGNREGQLKSGD